MTRFLILILCVSAPLRLNASSLPSVRQDKTVTRAMAIGPNTNRVSFITASKLIFPTNYVWTSQLWQSNADKIVTAPGSLYLAAPRLAFTLKWDVTMKLITSTNLADWSQEIVLVNCSVPIPNDCQQKYFRVPTDEYGNAPIGQSVVLNWNRSPSEQVVGYNVYYGSVSGIYTTVISVGDAAHFSVSGLNGGSNYFFTVTAVDAEGKESDPANEVNCSLPLKTLAFRPWTLD